MKLRLALVAALAAAPQLAHAGNSGIAIPETGGQTAGAASEGAEGLILNPAASSSSPGGELYIDAGMLYLSPSYTRTDGNGTGYAPAAYTVVSPHPTVSVAMNPRNMPLGFGLSFFVPYGRKARYPIEGSQRYHVADIEFHAMHLVPSVSYAPTRRLRFGAGPTFIYNDITLRQRVDMGVTIYQMDPAATPAPPVEDPFLEGELQVDYAHGFSVGWTAGVAFQPVDTVTLGVSYLSGPPVEMHGRSVLTPSLDLEVESHADFTMSYDLPPVVNAGVRWEATRNLTLGADFQWLGWSVMDRLTVEFANSELRGTNPEIDALLLQLGSQLDLGAALDKTKYIGRYPENTWNSHVMASTRVRDRWTFSGVVGYDQHAVPDRTVNAGNLDFDTLSVGIGVERELSDKWTFFATSTQLFPFERTVTDSDFDPYESADSGLGNTNANGTYSAFLHRAAVGFRYHWGQ